MKRKNTKKALSGSVLALVLCFVMLIGTTFAWFTSSDSTAVNKIEAGTLKIELQDSTGESLKGETLKWQKAGGHADEAVLWEPGASYCLQDIKIVNSGDLALKYKIILTGIQGDAELNNVIDWTIKANDEDYTLDKEFHLKAGASQTLTISGKMQESAGNHYQGMSIEGVSITVSAAQDTVEWDSSTKEYDKNASYLPVADVSMLADKDISYVSGMTGSTAANTTLNTAYVFKTTETSQQAKKGQYNLYHADFVVSADKDVPANSVMLAGYYSAYCDSVTNGNWIGLQSDTKIEAGQEIRLLDMMMSPNTMSYGDLCAFVPEFKCGAVDLTGANKGTTLTVELRLYEIKEGLSSTASIDAETGNYVVIGSYSYTF